MFVRIEACHRHVSTCTLDHISFATTYNSMGVVFDCRGDFDEALSHYANALE